MRYVFYFILSLPGIFLIYGALGAIFPLANSEIANLYRLGMIPVTSFLITYFIKTCEDADLGFLQYERAKLVLMGHTCSLFVIEIIFKLLPL